MAHAFVKSLGGGMRAISATPPWWIFNKTSWLRTFYSRQPNLPLQIPSSKTNPPVAVEAMMFGLPVVATNWRGLPDIVSDGETGFLVPPKDSTAIANRLNLLIENPDLRAKLGTAGRRRYEEKFTIEKFRCRMEEILSSLV